MKVKVLVTGSGGQLGKTIKELYNNNDLNLDFKFLSKTDLDITNQKDVSSCLKNGKYNYCINCAAYTNVEQAEKTPDPAYMVNQTAVKYLSEACKKTNTILIHISTDYVFDGEKELPYTVNDIPNPLNEYGKSKLLGEKQIQKTLKQYFIIRTSWLYSKKYGKNFYKTILGKAKLSQELRVTDEQMGCPTDTVSLARFIINIMIQNKYPFGIHHFCDGKSMTWFRFAELILLENNLKKETKLVKENNYITFAKRPKYTVLDGNSG